MAQKLSEKITDLLENMSFENPTFENRWFSNEGYDPPFGRTELNAAHKKRLIELDNTAPDHLVWRFRFTELGRKTLEKAKKS